MMGTLASRVRVRSVKVLDRFASDYALCMYAASRVEVCPFGTLFWSPDFVYSSTTWGMRRSAWRCGPR